MNWLEFDTYMIYNEDEKRAVIWTTYGGNEEYFLSQEYEYDVDCCEEIENTKYILVNELIDDVNTLEVLINKTKEMCI